eukprot:scaffold88358_cov71-Phaeocystis_antarctica.AAC.7
MLHHLGGCQAIAKEVGELRNAVKLFVVLVSLVHEQKRPTGLTLQRHKHLSHECFKPVILGPRRPVEVE